MYSSAQYKKTYTGMAGSFVWTVIARHDENWLGSAVVSAENVIEARFVVEVLDVKHMRPGRSWVVLR